MDRPYDLAVIGVRFPQLALATLLAKRGMRVAVLEERGSVPPLPGERLQGYLFRKRPAPLFGLDDDGILRRLLDEVGIGHLLVRGAYPANPLSYQVVLPGHRLDIAPGREGMEEQVAREWPGQEGPIGRYLADCDRLAAAWHQGYLEAATLEGRGGGGMRRLRSRLSVWSLARSLQDPRAYGVREGAPANFLALPQHFLGAYPMGGEAPALSRALVASIGRRGTYQEPDGTAGLASLLVTRFLEYGGSIEFGARVEAVTPARGQQGFTISLAGRGERRTARTIAGTDHLLLRLGVRGKAPAAPGGPPPLVPLRFYLGLRDRYVPVGMADNVLFLRLDGGGPLGIRALYLSLCPRGSSMAPPGCRSLTVTALVPADKASAPFPLSTEEMVDDLRRALEDLIPFLDEGLTMASMDLTAEGRDTPPRPLGEGLTALSPARVGRGRVRRAAGGRALLFGAPPWELGMEGEALMTLAGAGMLARALGKG